MGLSTRLVVDILQHVTENGRTCLSSRVLVRGDAIDADAGGDTVVLDLTSRSLFTLNAAGRVLWAALERPVSLAQLADLLRDHFSLADGRAAADASAFVDALERRGLVRTVDADT